MARQIDLRFGTVQPASSAFTFNDASGVLDSPILQITHGGTTLFGTPPAGSVYNGQTKLTSARETFYGGRVGVSHTYFTESTLAALVTQARSDLTAGRIPLVSVALTTSWANVAAGAIDAQLIAHFAALDAIGAGPILWCAQSEPNGNGPPASDYLAMGQHIKTLMAPYPQILLSPILAAGFSIMSGGFDMSDWMDPSSCHLPMFDSYNHISYVPDNGLRDLHISEAFGLQVTQLKSIFGASAPWGVAEWGVRTDPSRPGYASGWMADAYDFVRANNCYCFSYFDSGVNIGDGGSSWVLDFNGDGTDGTERLAEMKVLNNKATSIHIPLGGIPA